MEQNPTLNRLAKIISGLSSPFLLTATLPLFAVFYFAKSSQQFFWWGSLFVFFVSIIPFSFIALQVKAKRISDIHVALREQRTLPFLVALASSLILMIIYMVLDVPLGLLGMVGSILLNGVVYLLVTRYYKISIHTATLAGSATTLGLLVDPHWFYLYFALPLVILVRTYRGRHTLAQGLSGGLIISVLVLLLFKLLGLA